jgi:hypothetical protein
MAHGAMVAYGVTDWLELGAHFITFDLAPAGSRDPLSAGPIVRVRLVKDEGWVPQVSVGGYFHFGDLENYNLFLALYKRFEIQKDGFLRSVGLHAGIRETWICKGLLGGRDASDTPVGYFGLEFQLPARFYVVGEVSTKDRDAGGNNTPYAFGLQWRAGGVNISAAFLNTGAAALTEPSFFFGIGSQFKF